MQTDQLIDTSTLPTTNKVNSPVKLPNESHIVELLATLYLYMSIIYGVYQISATNTFSYTSVIFAQGYFIYLILAVGCNKTFKYLDRAKSLAEYEQVFYKFRRESGYFCFNVTCYHYQNREISITVNDQDGRPQQEIHTIQQKVVTHTACQTIYPKNCSDISGHFDNLQDNKQIIFMRYQKHFSFVDSRSAGRFKRAFSEFKLKHDIDDYQQASFEFLIPGFEERLSYFRREEIRSEWLCLWTLLGLAYPYLMSLEVKTARYMASISKQITM